MPVKVVLADGREIEVDTDDEKVAERAAQNFLADERRAAVRAARPKGYADGLGQNATQFQGLTLGLSDEIAGFGRGVASAAGELLRTGDLSRAGDVYQREYRAGADHERRLIDQYRKERPVASAFTEATTGMVAPSGTAAAISRIGLGPRASAAATGAVTGAAYGANTGVAPAERVERAALGAPMGAATSLFIGAGAKGIGAGLDAIKNIYARFGLTPDERAVRMIARGMINDGVTQEEVARRVAYLERQDGPTAEMIFEVLGPSARGAARASANVPGPGRAMAEDALTLRESGRAASEQVIPPARGAAAPPRAGAHGGGRAPDKRLGTTTSRVMDTARRATDTQGDGRTFEEFRGDLETARRGDARELYAAAYTEEVPAMAQIALAERMAGKGFKERALKAAIDRADEDLIRLQDEQLKLRLSNVESPEIAARIADEIADVTRARDALAQIGEGVTEGVAINPRAIDLYQRGLRHLGDAEGGAATEGGRNIAAVRRQFLDAADVVTPQLAKARGQYAEDMRVEELLDLGRRAMNSPESMDEVVGAVRGRNMSDSENEAVIAGVLAAIQSKLAAGDTAFVQRLMKRQDWQDVLSQTLGADAWKAIRLRIIREASMRASRNEILSGSRTTPLAEEIKANSDGEAEMSFFVDVINAGGDVKAPVMRRIAELWRRNNQPGIRDARVNEAMSSRLFNTATKARVKKLRDEIDALPDVAAMGDLGVEAGRIGALPGGQLWWLFTDRMNQEIPPR